MIGAGAGPAGVLSIVQYRMCPFRYPQVGSGGGVTRQAGRHYPAMSLFQVAGLVEDRARVEIEATAVVP